MAGLNEPFREAVQRLASSADEQEEYVRQLGTAPSVDELALEFSDALAVMRDDLDGSVHDAALRLDRYLEEISGSEHAGLWTVTALHTAPEWMRIRELANDVLRCIEDRHRPT